VVIESALALGYEIKGYFDIKEALVDPYQIPYLGFEKEVDLKHIVGADLVFPTVGDNGLRAQLFALFQTLGLNQLSIVDPNAIVSPSATMGNSTYVGKGSIVNAQTKIGAGVIINSGAIVEHECSIADACHIAPGATLCGNVRVGLRSLIGANSVVRPNISIANEVVLGAGSVLVTDINKPGTWLGQPAKRKI
jgi:sugar O-acyltransferase (sialic acid O-acetyltransferase NeuD family)